MTADELMALPLAVDMTTAALALGIGRASAYRHRDELRAAGLVVIGVGRRLVVTRASLLAVLGVEPATEPTATASPVALVALTS